jgi:hypothetical protein
MQADGNFVLYDGSGHPVWATGTNGKNNGVLTVQEDGNVVIYASFTSGDVYWAARSGPKGGGITLPGQQAAAFRGFDFVSDFTTLGYMVPRSGMWAQGSDIQKNLARQIAEVLTKAGSASSGDALNRLNAIGGADFLDLVQSDLQGVAKQVPLAWPGDPLAAKPVTDPKVLQANKHRLASHKAAQHAAMQAAASATAAAKKPVPATAGKPAAATKTAARAVATYALGGGAVLAALAYFGTRH